MVHNIADLTLDEVIARLIAGDTLQVTGGDSYTLASAGSRAILDFYSQDRRSYWNPDKDTNIQDGEVDRLLAALDQTPKAVMLPARAAATVKKWQLIKIEAHRFRGLHRHCEETGGDPRPFELELTARATLFRGFNGAGKTSLMSSVCWCLNGLGHHSQALHEPLTVQVAGHDDLPSECHRQMRLAAARRPQEQDGFAVGDETAGRDLADLRLVD